MSNLEETFFTSIGCMDGRVQDPVANYGRKKWKVKFADTITEAGLVKHLARHLTPSFLENIKLKTIDVSVRKHNSQGIIVHGHQECAGNPITDDEQKTDILNAAKVLRILEPGVEVIPVFIHREGKIWALQILEEKLLG